MTVSACQRIGDLRSETKRVSLSQRVCEEFRQRCTVKKLHHNDIKILMTADVVNRTDMRMIDLTELENFCDNPIAYVRILETWRTQNLDRDEPVMQLGISAAIHLAY